MRRVALIGAGFIAEAHLGGLATVNDAKVVAVVDPSLGRAQAMAGRLGAQAFSSVDELITSKLADTAHVLTPPPLHRMVAEPLLDAGIDVLLEKPMAETSEDCCALLDAAARSGAALRINHNFVYHPAFLRLKKQIEGGKYGKLRAVQMRFAAPLRQMAAKQFGHWMFDSPRNLLMEQVVHPLSLIDDLLGPVALVGALPGESSRPTEGVVITNRWSLSFASQRGDAQLQVILGANYPSWSISALCDDGVIDAEMFESRVLGRGAHAEIAPIDHARRSFKVAKQAAGQAFGGLGSYAGEILRLGGKSDGFNRSMIGSVGAFYKDLASGKKPTGEVGLRLVGLCEEAAAAADNTPIKAVAKPGANETFDVAVLGGTGFIGQHLTEALIAKGKRVAVMARTTKNLPGLFRHEQVGIFSGSISDPEAVADVVRRAPQVVNLAHGGGGATREAVTAAMVGGAETVAEACLAAGTERLLFVSSSAALWLGDKRETLDADTPPDQNPQARGDYAYAKVVAEEAMLRLHAERGLPVSILRPAVVVGEGGAPFHSALGAFNSETWCVGWNKGRNPLPFVLAEDVASAIVSALDVDFDAISGKAFNLVGDVRWTARQYIDELAEATGRPLRFQANGGASVAGMEWLKFVAKKVSGRKGVPAPSSRDLKSRGMVSEIDTSIEKRVLGWQPVADEAAFRERAILVHRD